MQHHANRAPRGACTVLIAGLALGWTSAAVAQSTDSGFEGSFRLGYGVPLGKMTDPGGDLSDGVGGQVPLWLDLGYRANQNLFLGLYFQYGIGFVSGTIEDACDLSSQIDCSVSDIRLGLQLHYHISPTESVDPWVGVGFGYEWLSIGVEGGGLELTMTPSGFEFLNLQAGLDFEVAQHFTLGPFVSFSIDQFDSISADCTGVPDCSMFGAADGDIEEKALHEWLVFGARATYGP